MPAEPTPFQFALLIFVVIMIFNLIIFIHELGHFWAAKWRGLKIDRFQIWFGKPIWSKTINGVQYGLGWIPAGGFVALPQMAPMQAIEGDNREESEPLPPISPLDKIIVAFAGPLFSFLLALTAACVITVVGKPLETVPTTTIGWVEAGSPGEDAGLKRGDKILAIDGQTVDTWHGTNNSVVIRTVTGRNDQLTYSIERPGVGPMEIVSEFEIPETAWWQRRATRQVGISPMSGPVEIVAITGENAPIENAGLKVGDTILSLNGTEAFTPRQVTDLIGKNGENPLTIVYRPKGESSEKTATVTPVKPLNPTPEMDRPMIGAQFGSSGELKEEWVHPGPFKQIKETLESMWLTITSVASPNSSIGIQHLSGPVGIGKIQYYTLLMDYPLNRILGFLVLININLAILNMLPFPVLDGGHITIAMMESIAKRPVNFKVLETIQLIFVFLLFSIMIYVTTKDIPDNFGMGGGGGGKPTKIVFPKPAE
ncbi:RIP metalloprotease RseP [Haloferula chungangensis]|uniref:Zinc metalloprotease n=1 Tax=Haloferula chungangensis TaxID=1048331 RepID=A0ABW2L9C9_9BACT